MQKWVCQKYRSITKQTKIEWEEVLNLLEELNKLSIYFWKFWTIFETKCSLYNNVDRRVLICHYQAQTKRNMTISFIYRKLLNLSRRGTICRIDSNDIYLNEKERVNGTILLLIKINRYECIRYKTRSNF